MVLVRTSVLAVLAAGCGRLGFDAVAPAGDAANDVDAANGIDAAIDAPPSDPSLQLHAVFEGSSVDVAKGRTISCIGGCPLIEPGRSGMAGGFDGTQCLEVADITGIETQSFTIALWFRATDANQSTMLSKPLFGQANDENSFELWRNSSGDLLFTVQAYVSTPASTAPGTTAWHHVAGTYDAGQIATYFDGVLQNTTTATTSFAGDPILIGCDQDNGSVVGSFGGQLDDVRIYDRALSAGEIAALAQ